jgi:hypothetical protein
VYIDQAAQSTYVVSAKLNSMNFGAIKMIKGKGF